VNVLVIGGAGFLGSHLIPELIAEGHRVDVMDVIPQDAASKLAPVREKIGYLWKSAVDVSSSDLVYNVGESSLEIDKWYYDAVVYLAAQADVPLSITSPKWTYDQNVGGVLAVLEAVRKAKEKPKLIYISTENVYGHVPLEKLPITEEQPFNPSNAYGASKAAAELLINAYVEQFNLPAVILRSTTMFGENSRLKQAVPIFIRQALHNKPITLEGDGSQSRDFSYVGNTVHGILLALRGDVTHGTFNIGSGQETTIKELAELVVRLCQSESKIVETAWRPGEKGLRLSISIEKAWKMLSYKPVYTFEDGLTRTINWLSELEFS
jgi:dTDP-glucose 4,6-dehydratase